MRVSASRHLQWTISSIYFGLAHGHTFKMTSFMTTVYAREDILVAQL